MDFLNRGGISLDDWQRGLDGFSIKMLPKDSKSVFMYLTGQEEENPNVLMTEDQFMRMHGEKMFRNIDPFEL